MMMGSMYQLILWFFRTSTGQWNIQLFYSSLVIYLYFRKKYITLLCKRKISCASVNHKNITFMLQPHRTYPFILLIYCKTPKLPLLSRSHSCREKQQPRRMVEDNPHVVSCMAFPMYCKVCMHVCFIGAFSGCTLM